MSKVRNQALELVIDILHTITIEDDTLASVHTARLFEEMATLAPTVANLGSIEGITRVAPSTEEEVGESAAADGGITHPRVSKDGQKLGGMAEQACARSAKFNR